MNVAPPLSSSSILSLVRLRHRAAATATGTLSVNRTYHAAAPGPKTVNDRQAHNTLGQNNCLAGRVVVSSEQTSRHFVHVPTLSQESVHRRSHIRTYSSASGGGGSDGGMRDEYGALDDAGETFVVPNFRLENGAVLPEAQLRYQTYGTLNETTRDNAVVVCHALTGNASLHSWWGGLIQTSPQQENNSNSNHPSDQSKAAEAEAAAPPIDLNDYYVVCCNILGSCYGSTNPTSINPLTNQMYGKDFPDVSVRDTVRLQLLLLQQHLKLRSIHCVIGGSFGGMQALEFAVQAGSTFSDDDDDEYQNSTTTLTSPEYFFSSDSQTDGGEEKTNHKQQPFVRSVLPIACGLQHTAWQIAISEVQRQAIYHDPAWHSPNPFQATHGLQVARQLGMISYRSPAGYRAKFGRELQEKAKISSSSTTPSTTLTTSSSPKSETTFTPLYGSQAYWSVKSYLEHQGQKFPSRFDPVTYVKLTEQMDSHDVLRGREGTMNDDDNTNNTTIHNGETQQQQQLSGEKKKEEQRAIALQRVLGRVKIPALVLGIDSDVLYPLEEQKEIVKYLPCATLAVVHSEEGHDGFLLEQEQVGAHVKEFLQKVKEGRAR